MSVDRKIIKLKPNGYDEGTWEEAKQELMEGWISESFDPDVRHHPDLERMADTVLNWVCDQLGIEEYEIAQR